MEHKRGKWTYFVREKHAWYDDKTKEVVDNRCTLDPQEGFTDFVEATARYDEQVEHRAAEGFVHSFSIDPVEGHIYRLIEPPQQQAR